jgi:nicotinamidase-related amidase
VTSAIYEVLGDREREILSGGLPDWLGRFVALAHAEEASLVTFNYDTLVERTVQAHLLYDWASGRRATHADVIHETPPFPAAPARFAGDGSPATFELLKLHGSLDYFWVPNDTSGATINRWDLTGSWGSPEAPDVVGQARYLPGREHFIVPPSATKSSFYDNPITRQTWHRAAEALRTADRVVLAGYSLPSTDVVTVGLLADHVRESSEVVVVDVGPETVADRLHRLTGLSATRVIGGVSPIPTFTSEWELEVARSTAADLVSKVARNSNAPVAVAWGEPLGGVVSDATRIGPDVVLTVSDELRPMHVAVAAHAEGSALPKPVTCGQLADLLEPTPSSVSVRFEHTGLECAIIDSVSSDSLHIGAMGIVLVPSGPPSPPP